MDRVTRYHLNNLSTHDPPDGYLAPGRVVSHPTPDKEEYPMATTLRGSMVDAHAQDGERALADLRAAATAPALFKPEWVERAEAKYEKALAGMRLWSA